MNPNLIDAALEQHLLTLPGAPSIAWEDVAFKPVTGQAYLQVNQLRNAPVDDSLTSDMRRDRGILQVTVAHPAGGGKASALNVAHAVAQHFSYGLELPIAGAIVLIDSHPSIASGYPDGGWYRIPVSVSWQAFHD